jgi:hypothetical protein
MNTSSILSVIALVFVGLSVLTNALQYSKKQTSFTPGIFLFMSVLIIGISQILYGHEEHHALREQAALLTQRESKKNIKSVWITLTTIPERLKDPWMRRNLIRTIGMAKNINATILLQVPKESLKGIKYLIPENVKSLQSPYFKISHCKKDEGPITKILPALRDGNIKPNDIIIVCDDDITYKKDTFDLLVKSVNNHSNAVSIMCNDNLEGFGGFAFQKHILQDLLRINIPHSCLRIDDDVISEYINMRNIKKVVAKSGKWSCSMDQKEPDTHSKWEELNSDHRKPLVMKCLKEMRDSKTI